MARAKTKEDFAAEFQMAKDIHEGSKKPVFHEESFQQGSRLRMIVQRSCLFLSITDFRSLYDIDPSKVDGITIDTIEDEHGVELQGVFVKDEQNPWRRVLFEHVHETTMQKVLLDGKANLRPSQGEHLKRYFDKDVVAQRPKAAKTGAVTESELKALVLKAKAKEEDRLLALAEQQPPSMEERAPLQSLPRAENEEKVEMEAADVVVDTAADLVGPALVLPGVMKKNEQLKKKETKGKGKGKASHLGQKRSVDAALGGAAGSKATKAKRGASLGPSASPSAPVTDDQPMSAAASAAPSVDGGSSGTRITGKSKPPPKGGLQLKGQAEKYLKTMDLYKALAGTYNPGKDYFQAGRVVSAIQARAVIANDAPVAEGTRLEARQSLVSDAYLLHPGSIGSLSPELRREKVAGVCSRVSPLPPEFEVALCQAEALDIVISTEDDVGKWLGLVSPFKTGHSSKKRSEKDAVGLEETMLLTH